MPVHKYATPEEAAEANRQKAREYYHKNKERCQQLRRERYQKEKGQTIPIKKPPNLLDQIKADPELCEQVKSWVLEDPDLLKQLKVLVLQEILTQYTSTV